jgi:hypothetical protein
MTEKIRDVEKELYILQRLSQIDLWLHICYMPNLEL